MRRVEGVVQHYVWGDTTFIPELLGRSPDGRPWAELWLGTHPNGPTVLDDGTPLVDLTGPLPFMVKVLAAAEPLSLQTHPDAVQAADGFARGVYPDANAKPELLCALTDFEALCGIRPTADTLELLDDIGAVTLADSVRESGPGGALESLYRGSLAAGPIVAACRTSDRASARWACRLDERYPGEASVAATLLLNHVTLQPGEALRLDAGNLHAYLCGAGIELMGNSDNVVRGGLTEKHVDVDELLSVVDATPLAEPLLPIADQYDLPAAGVALRRLEPDTGHRATGHELTLDLDGVSRYLAPGESFTTSAVTFVVVPLSSPSPGEA